ncbi:MAG: copper amine oxidase N-terminal domain-containing protein, partial [Sedimentibacter sp.]
MKKQKKVLILVLVISILFSGFAFANSTNGFFEGFSIINIFINGNKAEGDVPAINFHGRTMVPIRLIGEGLGANVQWDGNTSSVYI